MSWWVTQQLEMGPIYLGSWVFWVLFSITLHELAHGWTAIWQGDDLPIHSGHMTWNPIVHLGYWSLLIFAITGMAWGAMPIQPANFRSRYGEAMVALAGPGMNLLLSVVALLAWVLWTILARHVGEPVYTNVSIFLHCGAWLNIVLLILNLIPIPPLDGWRILADIFPRYNRIWHGEQGQVVSMVLFCVVYFRVAGLVSASVAGAMLDVHGSLVSNVRHALNL
jgi:Zn-dependent protease